jgi:hypothetical protein
MVIEHPEVERLGAKRVSSSEVCRAVMCVGNIGDEM